MGLGVEKNQINKNQSFDDTSEFEMVRSKLLPLQMGPSTPFICPRPPPATLALPSEKLHSEMLKAVFLSAAHN